MVFLLLLTFLVFMDEVYMKRVNQLVLCRSNYESSSTFNQAMIEAIRVLLENDYIMTIKYDEKGLGIVVIDYEDNDPALGGPYPFWLTLEEIDKLGE